MEIRNEDTDAAVAGELGHRLRQHRLNRELTQAEVAEQAGVSEQTVRNLESGVPGNLRNLVRVMRALGVLNHLDAAIPPELPSPIAESDRGGRRPQRIRKSRRDPDGEWTWGDDQ